mmetsp:Transcript_20100/g.39903  ORF Transcript_20100/g.39903 Transcript_20100/m.39903 type:complete len:248 (+) Transcript_20100:438-1181(+)
MPKKKAIHPLIGSRITRPSLCPLSPANASLFRFARAPSNFLFPCRSSRLCCCGVVCSGGGDSTSEGGASASWIRRKLSGLSNHSPCRSPSSFVRGLLFSCCCCPQLPIVRLRWLCAVIIGTVVVSAAVAMVIIASACAASNTWPGMYPGSYNFTSTVPAPLRVTGTTMSTALPPLMPTPPLLLAAVCPLMRAVDMSPTVSGVTSTSLLAMKQWSYPCDIQCCKTRFQRSVSPLATGCTNTGIPAARA